jgi:hypothetical protein
MYTPAPFCADDTEIRKFLTTCATADLITSAPDGLVATYLTYGSVSATRDRGSRRSWRSVGRNILD